MKGREIDLDRKEVRQGREVTPAEQGRGYAVGLPLNQQPRYVIACSFREIRVYDRNANPLCTGEEYLRLELVELPKNLPALKFLNGGSAPRSVQRAVSIEAGRIMGQINNEIAGLYHDPDSEESHHALSVLCTRLMFLMFCEDAGLIEPGLFRDYVASVDGTHLRSALIELFGWLDTDDEARKAEYPSELLARFPYMNGGLFRERIQIPQLNEQVHYEILVSGCQEFDWSGVDPTVFGSIFEGALSHDTRRSGGMHYTSPENTHKVIDPLFLDGLKEELDDILAKQNPSARTRALRAYHDKLGRLTFLDPACGSGNFLTETYVCLRRLENTVLMELQRGGQSEISFEEAEEESPVKVTLANFHGIEVSGFACCVARTALWIAEKQADINTAKVVKRVYDELPLREYGTIIHGNSLRVDWADTVPASGLDFIVGNPPFIGYSSLNDAQWMHVHWDVRAVCLGWGPARTAGKRMRMDFKEIAEAVSARKGAVGAAVLGLAALGGLTWALSTGPLTPMGGSAGSMDSMGSHSPADMGSAEADDDAMPESEETSESIEGEEPAAGGTDDIRPTVPRRKGR